jgi:hypothetical protein
MYKRISVYNVGKFFAGGEGRADLPRKVSYHTISIHPPFPPPPSTPDILFRSVEVELLSGSVECSICGLCCIGTCVSNSSARPTFIWLIPFYWVGSRDEVL